MKKLSVISIVIFLTSTVFGQQTNGGGEAGTAEKSSISPDTPRSGKVEVPAEKKRAIVIPKATAAPVIDGRVDEEIWQTAAVFKDFYQTNPGYNTQPSKPTVVYMMYDELHLYVAFKCWDERDKIRATVAKRDNVFGEDNVRLWLDTYNDQRRAYVLGFNPLGIQADGIQTEGQGADFSVDIVMESKGVIEDWGWSVEAKIPFKSLRYKSGKGVLWGFNVARNIDRLNDEFNQWLPDDREVSGFLIKHGKITGLDEIKYERTLEVVPSVTLSETGERVSAREFAAGRFVNHPIKKQIGVTLKYTLTPSITLDAAINPDFAEIEADAPVVTANQRFPIFFQEKRPFFLEGVDIFRSPLQVFYSRRIIDPDFAVKLSGKSGKTSFGILAASDNAPGNYSENERTLNAQCLERQLVNPGIRCSRDEFLDKNSLYAVLRLKRDFGSENNIGFFGTYRTFPEEKNLLAGFDGRIKFTPKITSSFQVVGTTSKTCLFEPGFEEMLDPVQAASNRSICGTGLTSPDPLENGTFEKYRVGNGLAYYVNLDSDGETHGWFMEAGGRSRFYRADTGFTRQTNTNFAFFFNRFSTKSNAKKKIIRANWNQLGGVDYTWDGRLQGYNTQTGVNLSLQRQTYLGFEVGTSYQKIYEDEFGLKRSPTRQYGTFLGDPFRATRANFVSANFNQTPNKWLSYGFFAGTIRGAFDYFFFECVRDTVTGECIRSNPANPDSIIILQNPGPGNQVDANVFVELKPIDPLRVDVSYNKSRLSRSDNGIRSFDSDIVTVRSTYQFTRFLFTRFRLDYDGNADGTGQEKSFGGQILLGLTPSPGTAFYVGYNDNLSRNGLNPYNGQFEPGFARNSRTFFIRASYLFRKSF
ncbi:MAG: DUF5916 domain-containing protein [Pyrinomonadaceae bacterium]